MDFDVASVIERLRTVGADVTAIEAKSTAGGLPQSVIPTMCAFANLPGGGLIIPVWIPRVANANDGGFHSMNTTGVS